MTRGQIAARALMVAVAFGFLGAGAWCVATGDSLYGMVFGVASFCLLDDLQENWLA